MKKIILLIILLANLGWSDEFRTTINNDGFYGTDQNYTHGTAFQYTFDVEPYTHNLFKKEVSSKRYSFGQYMYTPQDISDPELIPDDRPYAGVLYFENNSYMHSSLVIPRLQSFSYIFGVVGPASGAEVTQIKIHEITDSKTPMGWDNQLNNELVLNVLYTDRYRFYKSRYLDMMSHAGFALGNLHTYLNSGGIWKLGLNVPDNYEFGVLEPLPRGMSNPNFSIYGFFSGDAKLVLRNMMLDGNTFSDSHSVEKEIFVLDATLGIAINLYNIDMSYYYILRTEEFKGQNGPAKFGGISIAYKW